MAFDGITLNSIIKELQILVGAKINIIYQPTNNNILISVYRGHSYSINIDTTANNYRIHLTTHTKPNPLNAPNFCMLLRKYLVGSKITNIYMHGLERICYIEFECFNEMNDKVNRTLIIELMGKYSNIVLLNEKGFIIDALKKFDGNGISRDIMPAREYALPSQNKKDFISTTIGEFVSTIMNSEYKTLEIAIPNCFVGICKLFIQSCLDKLHLSNTVNEKSLKEIYNYIHNIIDTTDSCEKFKNDYTISTNIPDSSNNTNHFNNAENKEIIVDTNLVDNSNKFDLGDQDLNINFFLDDFYFEKSENETYVAYRNNLLKILTGTLNKLTKKMSNINDKIASCADMEKYKVYGELLIANIYKFNNTNFDKIVELENYYDNNILVKIPVDTNFSISQNAEKYFKKYNKLKNTLAITQVQKKETSKDLSYLESLVQAIDNCESISDINAVYDEISENILFSDLKVKNRNGKKTANESMIENYIKTTIDGFDVFIGKNNKQNDYLTLKVANENDYWFHTKDIHGSHLILRCNGEMPKLTVIQRCAELTAYYSQAKFSSHVPVDYTLAKYVKKPHKSAPGYVIYTHNKTIYVDPKS